MALTTACSLSSIAAQAAPLGRLSNGATCGLLAMAIAVIVAGCAGPALRAPADGAAAGKSDDARAGDPSVDATRRPGGYYMDDGPGDRRAEELEALAALPDPVPVREPLHSWANRPYRVLGNDYRPMTQREPFLQQGVASWYGKKFHGQLTSIGERYDMYRMTAAHPTLPIPSFVRVTNLENGRNVVVRVNDRGPFLHERAIDLSYLAAYKLGYVKAGSARVQVELLDPTQPAVASAKPDGTQPPVASIPVASTPIASTPVASTRVAPVLQSQVVPPQVVQTPPSQPLTGQAATPAALVGNSAPAATSPASASPPRSQAEATPAMQVSTQSPAPLPSTSPVSGPLAPPPAAQAAGHYLQLGAFNARINAEAASLSLRRQLQWLQVPIEVTPAGGLYRVQAGPYQLREQAALAGVRIESTTGLRPLLLAR